MVPTRVKITAMRTAGDERPGQDFLTAHGGVPAPGEAVGRGVGCQQVRGAVWSAIPIVCCCTTLLPRPPD
jgi:hypothetical protein